MRRRIALAAVLLGMVAPPATSAAQDTVVARDRYAINYGQALGGSIVYQRAVPRKLRKHRSLYMRVVNGRRSPIRGLPKDAYNGFEAIGRDRRGRVVLPFVRQTLTPAHYLVNPRWWLYDVATDRARPLRGLPAGKCTPVNVAVWRKRIAYHSQCKSKPGVFLRDGTRTRRVSRLSVYDAAQPLVLRGRTLMMMSGAGDGDFTLWRLVAGGETCKTRLRPSTFPPDHDFSIAGFWLTGRHVSWWMEHGFETVQPPGAGNLILGADLGPGCSRPGPTGSLAPLQSRPIAIDGPTLYHSVGRTLYARDISAGPSTAPPPNDDFAHAQEIAGAPPQSVFGRIGYGTRATTDPPIGSPVTATRTLWYGYRPPVAQDLYVLFDQEDVPGRLPYGAFAVYDDDGPGHLTRLPEQTQNDQRFVAFRANPAHHYWIGVGCASARPCFPSFELSITTVRPY
jgi:hypothetical protein